jgi:glutathione S-transferase
MPEITPIDPSIQALVGLHLWHAPLSSCSQRVRIVMAELGLSFESHVLNLEAGEHATAAYQAIHPKGVVPALVDNGRLHIESIDIIRHLAGVDGKVANGSPLLLQLADDAQLDLKLLTFEFLFRGGRPSSDEAIKAFQDNHQNAWLKQFYRDFHAGFDRDRIDHAVRRTAAGFGLLEAYLADGRAYLSGDEFSLTDIAWMPNAHRFNLMGWPLHHFPNLAAWFDRVRARPSYKTALMDWQPEEVAGEFAAYTARRQQEGTDICKFGGLQA